MFNKDIRQAIFDNNLKHYQVAHELGITSWTFSTWLRYPLDEDKKSLVMQAIDKLTH